MSTGLLSNEGVGAYGFVAVSDDVTGHTATAFAIVMLNGVIKTILFTMDDIADASEVPDDSGFWNVAVRWEELYPIVAEDVKGRMLRRIERRSDDVEKRQSELNRETAAFSDAAEEEAG